MSDKRQYVTVILIFSIFVSSFWTVVSEDSDETVEDEDSSREVREYLPETWHAVQTVPEGATGWIPREPNNGVVTIKRRRLRKRKRRPPIVSYLDPNAESVELANVNNRQEQSQEAPTMSLPLENTRYRIEDQNMPNRRKRPNAGDPWEELQEESVRPYVRRKVTPAYQTSDDISVVTRSESNLNPISASIRFGPSDETEKKQEPQIPSVHHDEHNNQKEDRFDEEPITIASTATYTKKPSNLKEILKQNGGLSLSEILQKKNITLSELLLGKKEAIKALTESPATTESTKTTTREYSENLDTTKYRRLPPSVALKKDFINRRYQQSAEIESLSDKEMMEAQRKRLALLQGQLSKGPNKFTDVTRYEVITEPTTEKRIFVPSHPQLYTSISYKPDLDEIVSNTEPYVKTETPPPKPSTEKYTLRTTEKTETTSRPTSTKYTKFISTKAKGSLPITSAKLMKMVTKKPTTPTKPSSAPATIEEDNYPKISGSSLKPFQIDVKEILGYNKHAEVKKEDAPLRMNIDLDAVVEPTTHRTTPNLFTFTTSPTLSSKVPDVPKLEPFTAKEEILLILRDPRGKAGLSQILQQRNMTIQELIEQRERGSSQLHLADIFHNKTREPEPIENEALEGKISSEVFTSFPVFGRQPKQLVNREDPRTKNDEENGVSVTAFPSFKIEVKKENVEKKKTFPWQQLYPDLFQIQGQNNQKPIILPNPVNLAPTAMEPADILTEEDLQLLKDLEQKIQSSVSSEEVNIVSDDPDQTFYISSGVKSAIIASLAIVSLSMIVFVTILFTFKLIQRRKKRLNYVDSLKPPLFDIRPRNIKTFMAETLGRNKVNYYRRHLHSMSDEGSWDKPHERNNVF